MLMRIIRARAKLGKWAQFERQVVAEAPDIVGVEGLRGRWIASDLDALEAGFIVALWSTEADALAFEHAAERDQLLTHPLPGDFEFHLGEIRSAWVAPAMRG